MLLEDFRIIWPWTVQERFINFIGPHGYKARYSASDVIVTKNEKTFNIKFKTLGYFLTRTAYKFQIFGDFHGHQDDTLMMLIREFARIDPEIQRTR